MCGITLSETGNMAERSEGTSVLSTFGMTVCGRIAGESAQSSSAEKFALKEKEFKSLMFIVTLYVSQEFYHLHLKD